MVSLKLVVIAALISVALSHGLVGSGPLNIVTRGGGGGDGDDCDGDEDRSSRGDRTIDIGGGGNGGRRDDDCDGGSDGEGVIGVIKKYHSGTHQVISDNVENTVRRTYKSKKHQRSGTYSDNIGNVLTGDRPSLSGRGKSPGRRRNGRGERGNGTPVIPIDDVVGRRRRVRNDSSTTIIRRRRILTSFSFFYKALRSNTLSYKLFKYVSQKTRATSVNDVLDAYVAAAWGAGQIIDAVIPKLGKLFGHMVITSVKITYCLNRNSFVVQRGESVCSNQYARKWGCRPEREGDYSRQRDYILAYRLDDCSNRFNRILKKSGKNINALRGPLRTVVQAIRECVSKFSLHRNFTKNDMNFVLIRLFQILGVLGNGSNRNVGIAMIDDLSEYGEKYESYGIVTKKHRETITKSVKKSEARDTTHSWNGEIRQCSDDEYTKQKTEENEDDLDNNDDDDRQDQPEDCTTNNSDNQQNRGKTTSKRNSNDKRTSSTITSEDISRNSQILFHDNDSDDDNKNNNDNDDQGDDDTTIISDSEQNDSTTKRRGNQQDGDDISTLNSQEISDKQSSDISKDNAVKDQVDETTVSNNNHIPKNPRKTIPIRDEDIIPEDNDDNDDNNNNYDGNERMREEISKTTEDTENKSTKVTRKHRETITKSVKESEARDTTHRRNEEIRECSDDENTKQKKEADQNEDDLDNDDDVGQKDQPEDCTTNNSDNQQNRSKTTSKRNSNDKRTSSTITSEDISRNSQILSDYNDSNDDNNNNNDNDVQADDDTTIITDSQQNDSKTKRQGNQQDDTLSSQVILEKQRSDISKEIRTKASNNNQILKKPRKTIPIRRGDLISDDNDNNDDNNNNDDSNDRMREEISKTTEDTENKLKEIGTTASNNNQILKKPIKTIPIRRGDLISDDNDDNDDNNNNDDCNDRMREEISKTTKDTENKLKEIKTTASNNNQILKKPRKTIPIRRGDLISDDNDDNDDNNNNDDCNDRMREEISKTTEDTENKLKEIKTTASNNNQILKKPRKTIPIRRGDLISDDNDDNDDNNNNDDEISKITEDTENKLTKVPVNGKPSASDVNNEVNRLYQLVLKREYERAVNISIAIGKTTSAEAIITKTVNKLLDCRSPDNHHIMSYAYLLWKSAEDIVTKYFPKPFKNIFNKDEVKIVNKEYKIPLKLAIAVDSVGDRQAYGDYINSNPKRLSWKFEPIWDDGVIFKMNNVHQNNFLKLALAADSKGYRLAFGSNGSDTDRHKFYLGAQNEDNELVFFIVNYKYSQGLELNVKTDNVGDRELRAHNGDKCPDMDRFKWIISKF